MTQITAIYKTPKVSYISQLSASLRQGTNMQINISKIVNTITIKPDGRLDSAGSNELQVKLNEVLDDTVVCAILDMKNVSYLSSAALRVFISLQKKLIKRLGSLAFFNLQDYSQKVIEISGLKNLFKIFNDLEHAEKFCMQTLQDKINLEKWDSLEIKDLEIGKMRIMPAMKSKGVLNVLGHVEDVLYANITEKDIRDKLFKDTEYSIGLGGLGESVDDYFKMMGEMITIGGTMVWLPTDGNDTPDFLIPRTDAGQITLKTVFNASIQGDFNEYYLFESCSDQGSTLDTLYKSLFKFLKDNRGEFKGVIGLGIIADMGQVYGSGVNKSPIKEFAPANGESIIHESNIKEWFTIDSKPHYENITALICGVGADLTMDLSFYDKEQLDSVFYVHPSNKGTQTQQLHNHAVMFDELPFNEKMVNLDKEVRRVVEIGNFIDMRHLLDNSTIKKAMIGVSFVQEIENLT